MKHTSITPIKYLLTILAIAFFLLISCSEEQSTSPSGGTSPGGGGTPGGTSQHVDFALSDSDNSGNSVTPSTELSRGNSYRLVISQKDGASSKTANYKITVTPEDAITINRTLSNSIDFTVNNTPATKVTITATHIDDANLTATLELKLASQADVMSFALTNRIGRPVDTTTELARAGRYGLVVKREGGATLKTASYDISATPEGAITIDVRRSNSVEFTVNNAATTTVTITAKHRDNPVITKTLELKLAHQADFINFTLTNSSGGVDTTTALVRAGRYGLVVSRKDGDPFQTEDYTFSATPADAITIDVRRTNSIDFTVNNTAATKVTITATHKNNPVITKTLELNFATAKDFMIFTLHASGVFSGGAIDINAPLIYGSNYGIRITPTSEAPLPTTNYDITFSPDNAITRRGWSWDYMNFTVDGGTSLTITATHRDNPSIAQSVSFTLEAPADFMSFTLTDNSGVGVDPTTKLARAGRYGLRVRPEIGASIQTADYTFRVTPDAAITIDNTRSDSIDFRVNNTAATSVTITAAHSRDASITESFVLNLAPRADFMNFVLNDRGGTLLATNTLLVHGNSYVVTVNPTSEAPLQTADYDITILFGSGITQLAVNANSITFRVENGATDLRIIATHKNNSIISRVLDLNFVKDYMSFTLTNHSGTVVDTTTLLPRGETYGLLIKRENGATLTTENYNVAFSPADVIVVNVVRPNLIDFTVNSVNSVTVTVTVTHQGDTFIRETLELTLASAGNLTDFQQDIENIATVPNLTTAKSSLTREVLTPLGVPTGTPLVKRYVTEAGAGRKSGSSWENAWAATDLRNNIDAIRDASANKVYLVMIAGGTYKPTYDTTRSTSFSMKNYVAIMGGFKAGGGWERAGTTVFSGDIGTVDDNTDNSDHVFYHRNLGLGNSHLYGVTITKGNANAPGGGGMYNFSVSPKLTWVTFSENTTAISGGGMYNGGRATPVLNNVVFSGNTATATGNGGGMYNDNSSPVLNNVTFSGNTANKGGGMYNISSSPVLTSVVFSRNTATRDGGGMYHSSSSSPVLTSVVFDRNTADNEGGGMYNTSSSSPVIRNAVFSGNNADKSGGGIYNTSSSPVIRNTVFSGNTATTYGGGMYNHYFGSPVLVGTVFNANRASTAGGGLYHLSDPTSRPPRILNTIFSGNTAPGPDSGPDILVNFSGFGYGKPGNFIIAGSVLGTYLTTGQPTDAIVGFNGTVYASNRSLSRNTANLTGTATLTVNGVDVTYPTITAGSSAINLGLYVRKSGTTYYFSEDNATWYTGFTTAGNFDGAAVTPPADAENLSATDITGKARTGRPDAGVNEL